MSTFSVTAAVCSFREVKSQVLPTLFSLRDCPDPKIEIKIQDGDALISRSRSLVAKYFLEKTNNDILMFLDDDVKISPFDATKLMQEAYQLKLPIVGAAYVTKSKKKPGFAIRPLEEGKLRFGKDGVLTQMRHISTGCICIRREVFVEMVKSKKIPLCKHGHIEYHPFFQHRQMVIDGVYEDMSEDWFFCEMARNLGFEVWLDTTIKLGHIGNYEYNWDDIVEVKNSERKNYDAVDVNVGFEKNEPIWPERAGSKELTEAGKEKVNG